MAATDFYFTGQSSIRRIMTSAGKSRGGSPIVAAAACTAYSLSSITMVIANKALVSVYGISLPVSLLLFQNAVAVVLLQLFRVVGAIELPRFEMSVAKKWLPVNIVFVSMLLTGFFSLKYLSVPMVTVFKNAANILIVGGERYILLEEEVSYETIFSLVLVVISSVCAAMFDLSFNLLGYFWMFLNCCGTASYVLYMRWASKHVRLSKFGMVMYNNALSLPILLLVIMFNGELSTLMVSHDQFSGGYLLLAGFSGVIGFVLSLASFWCVGVTSATTYAVVGAMNKIPLAILSIWLFDAVISQQGYVAMLISLAGGFMYSHSKIKQGRAREVMTKKMTPKAEPPLTTSSGGGRGGGTSRV